MSGPGLYTEVGHGSRNYIRSGLVVRFKLNPMARINVDFKLHSTTVIILNKNAIQVVRKPTNIEVIPYFRTLASGNIIR